LLGLRRHRWVKMFRCHRDVTPARAVSPVHGNTECLCITVLASLGLHYLRLVKQVVQMLDGREKYLEFQDDLAWWYQWCFLISEDLSLDGKVYSSPACRAKRYSVW
jgi:hypothetical protein